MRTNIFFILDSDFGVATGGGGAVASSSEENTGSGGLFLRVRRIVCCMLYINWNLVSLEDTSKEQRESRLVSCTVYYLLNVDGM